MKARFCVLAALLMTSSSWAFAASHVDLSVKGTITPSACTPTFSSNGIVELGKVAVSDIPWDKLTYLPPVPMRLDVTCEAATLFALAPQDNRPQMSTLEAFGFVEASAGKPIGAYFLQYESVVADGVARTRLYSENDGQTWRLADPRDPVRPRELTAFGEWISGPASVLPIQNLNLSLRVEAFLYPGSFFLPVTEELPIDGLATFELRYL